MPRASRSLRQRAFDDLPVRFASAGRGTAPGTQLRLWRPVFGPRVGGHLYGRFWLLATPPTRSPYRDSGSLEIPGGGFPPNLGSALNPPQRPAKPAQCNDLLLLLFTQDIHRRRVNLLPSMSWVSYLIGRFSGVHRWPDLGVHRGLQDYFRDCCTLLWTNSIASSERNVGSSCSPSFEGWKMPLEDRYPESR